MKLSKDTTEGGAPYLRDPAALQEGLRLGHVGIWRWRVDSDLLEWTENLEGVHGLPHGSFDASLGSFHNDIHPDDAGMVWKAIARTVETGEPYRAVYRTSPKLGSHERWVEASGGLTTIGATRYMTGVCLDVTERVVNERVLIRRLKQQSTVAEFGSLALTQVDLSTLMDTAVSLTAEVLGAPLAKILQYADSADHLVLKAGIGWTAGLVGTGVVGTDKDSQAGYTLLSGAPVIVRDLLKETRFNGPPLLHDHNVRSGVSVVIPGSGARPLGVFGVHTREQRDFDDTDAQFLQSMANIVAAAARQAAAASHHQLLLREMAHRAGNMLQLVNSIASKTFSGDTDSQVARKSFSERLGALARSNFVVSRGGWIPTRFADLVEETTRPFGARIAAQGRDVLLPPDMCFDMGLVLHELATNSMKYGALGGEKGNVTVNWAVLVDPNGQKIFQLDWNDPRPRSQERATRVGFGTRLVRALIEEKWNGIVEVESAQHFRTKLRVPMVDQTALVVSMG